MAMLYQYVRYDFLLLKVIVLLHLCGNYNLYYQRLWTHFTKKF